MSGAARLAGLAPWRAGLPDVLARAGGWALMGAEQDTTPEARLRRQVAWCRAGEDVVPLSPRAAPTVVQAQDWLHHEDAALERAHARLRGRVQAVVQLDLPRSEPVFQPVVVDGRSWLQARAAQSAEARSAGDMLDARLRAVMARLFPSDWQMTKLEAGSAGHGLRLRRAVLLPRAGLHAFAAALSDQIGAAQWVGQWDMVAPLPPLAFAALSPTPFGEAA